MTDQSLPGAPDPWASSRMPELRDGPPFLMTEMIEAEPFVAARVAGRVTKDPAAEALLDAIRSAAARGEPLTTTGCGTSEHAAQAAAYLLADALPQSAYLVRARQALDAWRDPQASGVVIGVSHEGGTAATNEALTASRGAGARTALVTVSDRSPGAAIAEIVVETAEQDQSWCHTVGYISPIVAVAAIAARLRGGTLDSAALSALLTAGVSQDETAREVATSLAACERLLIVGAGMDLVSARELALKIEEGAGQPAAALHLESVRHGHLAAAGERIGLVLLLTDADPAAALIRKRAASVLRAASALGMPAAAIAPERLGTALPPEGLPAGQLTVPTTNALRPTAERVIGPAPPMQLLALQLAIARGRDPDPIGRDDPRQAAAAIA